MLQKFGKITATPKRIISSAIVLLLLTFLAVGVSQSFILQAAPAWMDTSLTPGERANLLLAQMTIDEKITMVHGGGTSNYVGHVMGNTRLNIPELNMSDGPSGVANGKTQVTAFPAPIGAAATWDYDLVKRYGAAMGQEQRGKGSNVHLAPMMNIDRAPQAGRNWEGYGEDPYLSAQMAAAEVIGIQSNGIIATAKHYIDNDQETNRETVSAAIDDRTQHEIYLPPFKACVRAGVGSVMGSYNKVNGVYACENPQTLTDILKVELGFTGWVMSDWGATHSTVEAANSGFDQQMPGSNYFGTPLKTAVQAGQVPQSRLDDMVLRILTSMFAAGLFDRSPDGNVNNNVQSVAHTQVALDVATQGLVLLKNDNNVLPVNTSQIKSIAVIGSAASTKPIVVGGGSGNVQVPYVVTPLQGITNRAGSGITVKYVEGETTGTAVPSQYLKTPGGAIGLQGQYYNNTTVSGSPVLTRTDSNVDFSWSGSPGTGVNTTNWSARWTGTLTPPTTGNYILILSSDDGSRMYINGALTVDNWGNHGEQGRSATVAMTAGQSYNVEIQYYQGAGASVVHFRWITPTDAAFTSATSLASQSDMAIIVVGMASSEGSDRPDLTLPGVQDSLISAVAQVNPRTIVLIYAPAQILMPWASQVEAVLYGWVPGQEEGNAFASVVFGDVNPSGRLPMTFAQNMGDYPCNTAEQFPGVNNVVTYSEGLFVGYRHFDGRGITPLFPFGHGLSYTTFSYSNLTISPAITNVTGNVTVTANVTNTGSRAGAEIAQLYVGFPTTANEPPKQLKGFQKIMLQPGQTQPVSFTLTPEEFSIWNTTAKNWVVVDGTYQVMIGASSRDIRLTGSFQANGSIVVTPTPTIPTTITPTATPTSTTPTATPTPGGPLSQGKPVSASSAQAGNIPANANDGNATTTRWCAVDGTFPQWWKVDLGTSNNLTKVDINWYSSSNRAYKYKIEVSSNDSAYTTAVDKTGNTTNGDTSDSLAVAGRYVRITVTGSSAGYASAYEIKVYGGSNDTLTPTPIVTATSTPTSTPTATPTPTVTPTVTPTPKPTMTVTPSSTPTPTSTSTPTPTPSGITLLSQGKTATASTSQGNNPPSSANDGNTSTRWSATSSSYPQWWKVDLGTGKNLSKVDINWYSSSSRAYKYQIEVSSDDLTYTTKVDKTGNATNGDTSDSFAATGRYVRITVTGCTSGAAYASAYEIKVYGN